MLVPVLSDDLAHVDACEILAMSNGPLVLLFSFELENLNHKETTHVNTSQ